MCVSTGGRVSSRGAQFGITMGDGVCVLQTWHPCNDSCQDKPNWCIVRVAKASVSTSGKPLETNYPN